MLREMLTARCLYRPDRSFCLVRVGASSRVPTTVRFFDALFLTLLGGAFVLVFPVLEVRGSMPLVSA
jgi:hypothetical protein